MLINQIVNGSLIIQTGMKIIQFCEPFERLLRMKNERFV